MTGPAAGRGASLTPPLNRPPAYAAVPLPWAFAR
jgi:hypothetical protein